MALEVIGQFHSSSFILKNNDEKTYKDICKNFKEQIFTNIGNNKFLDSRIDFIHYIAKQQQNYNSELIDDIFKITIEKFKPNENEYCVLCHRDLWHNNIMFNENQCKLVDFQLVSYTSCILDVIVFINLNSLKNPDENFEKKYIEIYYKELLVRIPNQILINEKINLENMMGLYKQKRICGLTTKVVFSPIILLNDEVKKEYFNNNNKNLNSNPFLLSYMEKNSLYKKNIEEMIEDLIRFTK